MTALRTPPQANPSAQRPRPRRPRTDRPAKWAAYADDALLVLRFRDLGLRIEGTWLVDRIAQLHQEIAQRGIRFRPHCWLSSDWFSPDGVPGIAIPFYLAHRRLMKLEDRKMLVVEGGTKTWCMKLLRHEAGHAIQTAFRLNRRAEWRRQFGPSTKPYPKHYLPEPFSKNHVQHLDWWYAQSHPCEDFAETFAVWLKPGAQWRRRYKGWPALAKIEYVDALMADIAGKIAPIKSCERMDPLHELDTPLAQYYEKKQDRYGSSFPEVYDRDLRRLFEAPGKGGTPAASLLRRVGPEIRRRVAVWTGEHVYTINQLLSDMITRCRELDIRANRPVAEVRLDAAILLTMQFTNFLQSGAHRLAI